MSAIGDVVARLYVTLPVDVLPEFGEVLERLVDADLALTHGTEGARFDVVVVRTPRTERPTSDRPRRDDDPVHPQ